MPACNFCKTRNLRWVDLNQVNVLPLPTGTPINESVASAPRWQLQNLDGTRHSCILARVYYRARALNNDRGRRFMAAVDEWLRTHPEGATTLEVVFPNIYVNNRNFNTDFEVIDAVDVSLRATAITNDVAMPTTITTASLGLPLPSTVIPAQSLSLLPLGPPTVVNFDRNVQSTNDNTVLNWRGIWVESLDYARNDVVIYASHIYVATTSNTGKRPGNSSWASLTTSQQERLYRTGMLTPVERVVDTPVTVKRAIRI